MPMFFGYVRSRASDNPDGSIVAAHKQAIETEFAARWKVAGGWEWGGIFEDDGTAGTTPLNYRPQGMMLSLAFEWGDVVCFPSLDRSFRSAKELANVVAMWTGRGMRPYFLEHGADASSEIGAAFMKGVETAIRLDKAVARDRAKYRVRAS